MSRKNPKTIYKTLSILTAFINSAGVQYKQHEANKLKQELKSILTGQEYQDLSIAHSHYIIGEGRDELDAVCKILIEKYGPH